MSSALEKGSCLSFNEFEKIGKLGAGQFLSKNEELVSSVLKGDFLLSQLVRN
jgi:hypothetical protein